MKLEIINLLPQSSHKNVIDNGYVTSRSYSVINSWHAGGPAVGYDVVTDGSDLYCEDYLCPDKNVLIGETVNGRKVLYDYTKHFLFWNKNERHGRSLLNYTRIARNIIICNLNYSLPSESCIRFERCKTYHRKPTDCSGIQIRYHGKNRRIIKTSDLYNFGKYGKIPFIDNIDFIISTLNTADMILKPPHKEEKENDEK